MLGFKHEPLVCHQLPFANPLCEFPKGTLVGLSHTPGFLQILANFQKELGEIYQMCLCSFVNIGEFPKKRTIESLSGGSVLLQILVLLSILPISG